MQTRLEQIIATHRAAAAADNRYVGELLEIAEESPAPREFRQAIIDQSGISVIAEIKRRSPSAGELDPDLDPAWLAKQYEAGGATCLSVLTDVEFFGGSIEDLHEARQAVTVPVLRKDFTVSEADIVDARIEGADAVLLIVAALEDDELWRFARLAEKLDLAALFEVHDENELERAVRADATIVGVNQRNLHDFEIDRSLAQRMRPMLPDDVVTVAESGVRSAEDVMTLSDAGYDAVLVGTSLVTADGPAETVRKFIGTGPS